MLDHHDREKYAAVYRLLADVLEREPPAGQASGRVSYLLGDLAGRVFVGTPIQPPDEVLEATAEVLRTGDSAARLHLAARLRSHAEQLGRSADDASAET